MIRYLKHNKIDKTKWDVCIELSLSGLIYAQSWYLDMVAPGWDALVKDDYKAVMPLPVKRKFGLPYVFVPHFCQQLGVISKDNKEDVNKFLVKIPAKFVLVDQKMNEQNPAPESVFKWTPNQNFVLSMGKPYEEIVANYNRNCKRNIKKAEAIGFNTDNQINPNEFVAFTSRHLSNQLEHLVPKVRTLMQKVIGLVLQHQLGELVRVVDSDGITQAVGFYIFNGDRLIFSICASSPFGKKHQAMYKLVDDQIRKYSEKFKFYDFSGSNNEGIAYFNSTFGAKSRTYVTIGKKNGISRLLK